MSNLVLIVSAAMALVAPMVFSFAGKVFDFAALIHNVL